MINMLKEFQVWLLVFGVIFSDAVLANASKYCLLKRNYYGFINRGLISITHARARTLGF